MKILLLILLSSTLVFGQTTKRGSVWAEKEETFELAPPEKEFSIYSKVKLVKQ